MNKEKLKNLVKKAVQKDNGAMEELYNTYYTDVYFICKKYNLSDADAEDITQDTFLKAFNEIGTLSDAEKFPSWIFKIASNKCLNLIKHNKVIDIASVNEDGEVIEIPDKAKKPDEIMIEKEVSDILSDMIARLPIEQRVTIFMYYYQEYSIKEIAKAYGCSENTVKSRLNYARKTMREETEKLEDKGVKLRVVAVLPFLYLFFAGERKAFACEIPDCVQLISKVMGVAKPAFFTTLTGKLVIGAVALAITAGGITAAIILTDKNNIASNGGNTVNSESNLDNENSSKSDKFIESKYDYEIKYINEEGIANGNFTFGLGDKTIMFGEYDSLKGTEWVIGQYKNNDIKGDDFVAIGTGYPVAQNISLGYEQVDIVDNIGDYNFRIQMERVAGVGKESAEEYAIMDNYDYPAESQYYYGDYYIYIIRGDVMNTCYGYKYMDSNLLIRIRMFISDGDEKYKENFERILDRLSFEYVGDKSNITGYDKCYLQDSLAVKMKDRYGICLKNYQCINEVEYRRIEYNTDKCKYKIEPDNGIDLSPESADNNEALLKMGEYEDGLRVYLLRAKMSDFCFLVVKDSTEYASIRMNCDIPDENIDELFEMLREDLLK